jgi:hypothetical protein
LIADEIAVPAGVFTLLRVVPKNLAQCALEHFTAPLANAFDRTQTVRFDDI